MKSLRYCLVAGLFFFLFSCIQWDLDEKEFIEVVFEGLTATSCNGGDALARVIGGSDEAIELVGFVWSSSSSMPTLENHDGMVEASYQGPSFRVDIEFADSFQPYYISAFVSTSFGEVYSEAKAFQTGWHKNLDFPGGPREHGVAFVIGDRAYVGLGFPDQSRIFRWFDSKSGQWGVISEPFPGPPRCCAVAFSVEGKGYVGTGISNDFQSNEYFSDFYEFDPEKISDNPWRAISPLPGPPRAWASAFVVGDKAYLGGRNDENGRSLFSFYRLVQENGSWENIDSIQKFGVDREEWPEVGFSARGRGFVLLKNKEIWEYLPDAATWDLKPEFQFPGDGERINTSAWPSSGKAYLGLGLDNFPGSPFNPTTFTDLWAFDPETPPYWVRTPIDFPGLPRHSCINFAINGKGYLLGGKLESEDIADEFWEFCLQ